jgi:hypothetical protein
LFVGVIEKEEFHFEKNENKSSNENTNFLSIDVDGKFYILKILRKNY